MSYNCSFFLHLQEKKFNNVLYSIKICIFAHEIKSYTYYKSYFYSMSN